MSQLLLSASPHLHGRDSTRTIMRDVVIALMPSLFAATMLFGWRSLAITAVCVASCVASEYLSRIVMKRPQTVSDLSAIVTGILLAFNLPVDIPLWQAAFGGVVAIVVVKQMFGGIGCNFMNPALAARAVLLASWPTLMTATNTASAYPLPFDTVTSATVLVPGNTLNVSMIDLMVGRIPGTIGEVCKVAILIGLVYMLVRKTITWHIPVTMIVSFMVFEAAFGLDPITGVLSGGILFGAVFMATDYVTSPMTPVGQIIYAVGAGLIVALIRAFGGYPEGVTYAILLMNIVTPLIDRAIRPRVFGEVKGNA